MNNTTAKTSIGTLALGMVLGVSITLGIGHVIRSHPTSGDSTWSAKHFVLTYKNHYYHVSEGKIASVGRFLTTISYHGNYPGMFGLYAIPGVQGYDAIAVATSSGYLLAIKRQPIV